MSLFSFSAREQKIFIVLLLVCGIFGVYTFVYRPAVIKGEEIDSEISRTRQKLSDQQAVIEKEQQMALVLQDELETVRQKRTNDEEMSSILSDIEAMGSGMNIKVTEIKPQEVKKQDFLNRFSVSLTVDGNLMDMMRFIHALQDPAKHVQIRQLSLERAFVDSKEMLARMVVERTLIP